VLIRTLIRARRGYPSAAGWRDNIATGELVGNACNDDDWPALMA